MRYRAESQEENASGSGLPPKTRFSKWVGVEYERLLPESKVVKKLRKVNNVSRNTLKF